MTDEASPMPRLMLAILSGSASTRLWPLSQLACPKQLLPLAGASSLLQETASRLHHPDRFAESVLVAPGERIGRGQGPGHSPGIGRPRRIVLPSMFHRPWGTYQVLDEEAEFQVKRIVAKPSGRLPLQRYARRSEHWVVVRGIANVTIGTRVEVLRQNQPTYVPLGRRTAWRTAARSRCISSKCRSATMTAKTISSAWRASTADDGGRHPAK